MFARLLSAALAGCVVLLTGSTAFAYYSTDSSEGQVVFTGMVEIADDTPDFLIMPSYVSRQLLYLAGPLQAAPQKSPRSTFSASSATARPASSMPATAMPVRSFSRMGSRTS